MKPVLGRIYSDKIGIYELREKDGRIYEYYLMEYKIQIDDHLE